MTVRIASHLLVGLLMDLVHTAHHDPAVGGAIAGVLLHSDRGELGSDPGKTDLLIGTSMNRVVLGHGYMRAEGVLEPMLWLLDDVRAVIAVLKPKVKAAKEDEDHHRVAIRTTGDDMVEIVEDPDQKPLFDDAPWRMSFTLGRLVDYPRGVWDLLRNAAQINPMVKDGLMVVPALARTDFNAAALAPFVAVAKRRKCAVETYRRHQRLPVHVQIGSDYRGAIMPESYPDGPSARVEGEAPDAAVFEPVLPPRPEQDTKDSPADPDEDGGDDE